MKNTSEDIFEPPVPVVPIGWDVVPFQQAVDVVSDKGRRVKQGSYLPAGKIPVIDQGQQAIGGFTDDEQMAFDGELPVILFGDHTRSIKFVDTPFAVGAEGVKILQPRDAYFPKFLYYVLRSLRIPSRGYSRHFQFLRKFHFPLAPEEQQKRIVAEIEKQFSRLDDAVANLKRVKANLKRYKAAVLKAAVEGCLSDDCRDDTKSNGWAHKPIDVAIDLLDQGWSPQCDNEPSDRPDVWGVIKTTAVQSMHYLESENKRLPKTLGPRPNLELAAGDLLITRAGPRVRVGVACLVKASRPYLMLCDKVYRMRCKRDVVSPAFLELVLNAPNIVDELDRLKTGISDSGVNLTQKRLRKLLVPFPPLKKQHRIVAEVERRLSVIDELEAAVEANLKRADRLQQAVLKQAFEGNFM